MNFAYTPIDHFYIRLSILIRLECYDRTTSEIVLCLNKKNNATMIFRIFANISRATNNAIHFKLNFFVWNKEIDEYFTLSHHYMVISLCFNGLFALKFHRIFQLYICWFRFVPTQFNIKIKNKNKKVFDMTSTQKSVDISPNFHIRYARLFTMFTAAFVRYCCVNKNSQ